VGVGVRVLFAEAFGVVEELAMGVIGGVACLTIYHKHKKVIPREMD